jgi:predicted PurR-regulated permease PerM
MGRYEVEIMQNEHPTRTRRSNPIVVILLLLVIAVAIAAVYLFNFKEGIGDIMERAEGINNKDQVLKNLGQPTKKEAYRENLEMWTYEQTFPRKEQLYFIFSEDGMLLTWSDEKPEE